MQFTRLTPVLMVEAIEPCLDFWVNKLGFTTAMEVPHEGKLGFVGLEKGPLQIMYQTQDSVAADIPAIAKSPMKGTFLFIEVDDLNAVEKALKGIQPVVPRRTTFYGADELIVKDPAGNHVTFAEFKKEA